MIVVTGPMMNSTGDESKLDADAIIGPEITLPVGVGPWPGGSLGQAQAAAADARLDPELLANGDARNVVDRYRYWSMSAIVADLDTQRQPFQVAIENFHHDMNIGSVVRTANAFAAELVHIIGHRRWNRRGSMVTERYQHVQHHETIDEFTQWVSQHDLAVIGVDNMPGSVPLETFDLPRRCVLVFGQESTGLSPAAQQACNSVLSIAQFGSTRSINAGAAAAIAMHAWVRRHVFDQRVHANGPDTQST